MHWSKAVGGSAVESARVNNEIVVCSGISLSGPVHIGHSREFLTAALVANAIQKRGLPVKFIAFADDMDPLRKVYPFLSDDYARWVGCPLNRIPDPYSCHESYAEHFLAQLLDAFDALRISPLVLRSSEMYNSGKFASLVHKTLAQRVKVNSIIDEITARESKGEWPFMAECPICFSIQKTKVQSMQEYSLTIYCSNCDAESVVDLTKGGGKLSWRCDWPMRWAHLGVTVEPFGHDHNAAGGSYESGVRIARQIYGVEPPIAVPYAWIHFKSGGAMHSSSGKAVSIVELARAYPPEVIWWMIARRDPGAVISFDPQATLFEEVRLLKEAAEGKGAHIESLQVVKSIVGVRSSLVEYPLDHLILVAQLSGFNAELALRILQRSAAYKDASTPITSEDLSYIKTWLEQYGEAYRIQMRKPGQEVQGATAELRPLVDTLIASLRGVEWEAQVIHNTVHGVAKAANVKAGDLFAELYRYVIGQNRGPKIGWLFETLGREEVINLLA